MSSRYILDFAPAISVAVASFVLEFDNRLPRSSSKFTWLRSVLIAAIIGWWICEIVAARHVFPKTPTLAQGDVLIQVQPRHPELKSIPEFYGAGSLPSEVTGIRQNGLGWADDYGGTDEMVVLFVKDPDKVRLEIAPDQDTSLTNEQYAAIRAKVGREFLELESIEPTQRGQLLTFSGPKREPRRHGIQILSIAFVTTDEFQRAESPFRLLRVDW
jgi:hypothetical protein